MFLRCSTRKKDGKVHRYWSVVENRRLVGGQVVQRHVLYLGEINDQQETAWRRSVEVFQDGQPEPQTLALVTAEPASQSPADGSVIQIRLDQLELRRPRQWGGCWLACELYHQLALDAFFKKALPPSRKGTRWDLILQALVCYRLLDPGSEWHLHREWFGRSALAELLGADFSLAESHKLYRVHDQVLAQKQALFSHLQQRWKDLFGVKGDLALRPVYHQLDERIEAHVFIAFLAYCLHVTLRCRLRALAGGLTPRAVLEKFKAIQLIDVHLPTTDGRTVVLPRYTQPEAEHKILLQGLKLQLPEQPKPRITAAGSLAEPGAP